MSFRSPVVLLLYANLSARPVTFPKSKIFSDNSQALPVGFEPSSKQPPRLNLLRTVVSALQNNKVAKLLTPVQQAMANADSALFFEQRSALEKLLLTYSTIFSAGSEDIGGTSLIFHKIDIG